MGHIFWAQLWRNVKQFFRWVKDLVNASIFGVIVGAGLTVVLTDKITKEEKAKDTRAEVIKQVYLLHTVYAIEYKRYDLYKYQQTVADFYSIAAMDYDSSSNEFAVFHKQQEIFTARARETLSGWKTIEERVYEEQSKLAGVLVEVDRYYGEKLAEEIRLMTDRKKMGAFRFPIVSMLYTKMNFQELSEAGSKLEVYQDQWLTKKEAGRDSVIAVLTVMLNDAEIQ